MPGLLDRLFGREKKSLWPQRLAALVSAGGGVMNALARRRDIPDLIRSGYAGNPVGHRCIRLIAEAAAAIPLKANDAAVQRLLDAPNSDQAGPELWENLYGFLHVAGNAYLELVRLDDEPRQLLTLRPDRLRIETSREGWPTGWSYTSGGKTRHLARDPVSGRHPVFHIRLFHPGDDHYGLSPLQAAGAALDLHNRGGEWARALLENAARPSGALIVRGEDGRLSPDQFDRLKSELFSAHAGAENAGRPLLLEGGLDWKPMAMSPAELDYTNARREAAREIALALGVPPLLLGLPGDNTYSNYREANLAFSRQTVTPLVNKTARALTVWLRPWFSPSLEILPDAEALARQTGEDGHG